MRTLFCGCVLLLLPFAAFCGTAEPRVLRMAPVPRHVDIAAGVFFTATDWMLYAHDLESGKLLWSRSVREEYRYYEYEFGDKEILFCRDDGVVCVDKLTGQETWRQPERGLGGACEVKLLGPDGWFAVSYTGAIVLYHPDGKRYEITKLFEEDKGAKIVGWMPDEKSVLLMQYDTWPRDGSQVCMYFWDPESGRLQKAYDLDTGDWISIYDIFPTGELLLIENAQDPEPNKLALRDAETGALLRRMDYPGETYGYDRGRMVSGTCCGETCRLFDVESWEYRLSLEAPGSGLRPIPIQSRPGRAGYSPWTATRTSGCGRWRKAPSRAKLLTGTPLNIYRDA